MYLLSQSRRDGPFPQATSSFEKRCRSVSWRVWCPIDIVLWAIIFLVSVLLFWKLYKKTTKRRDSDDQSQVPQNVCHLQDDASIKNNDTRTADYPCGLSNIVRGPTITKDAPSPVIPTQPAPVLRLVDIPRNSSSGRSFVTGLGISFGSTSTLDLRFLQNTDFHYPQVPPSGVIMAGGVVEIENTPTPPPSYVRDILHA